MSRTFLGLKNTIKNKKYNSLKDAIIAETIMDRFLKLESKELNFNEDWNVLTSNTDMFSVREHLNSEQIRNGIGVLVYFTINNKPYIDSLEQVIYQEIGTELYSIQGLTSQTIIQEGASYKISIRYTKNNDGSIVMNRFITTEKEIIPIEQPIVYENTSVIPAKIFKNNHKMANTFEWFGVLGTLNKLDYYDKEEIEEWNISRTIPYSASQMSDIVVEKLAKDLRNGTIKSIEDSTINAQYGQGFVMQPAQQSVSVVQSSILLQDDILRRILFLKRDKDSTSTNKTILEIMDKEERMLSYIRLLKLKRQENYQGFIDNVSTFANATKFTVVLELDDLIQNKMKLLESSIIETQMKSDNINSQIDNNESEVEDE